MHFTHIPCKPTRSLQAVRASQSFGASHSCKPMAGVYRIGENRRHERSLGDQKCVCGWQRGMLQMESCSGFPPNHPACLAGSLMPRVALLIAALFVYHRPAIAADREFHFENDIEPILSRYGCNSSGCHGKAEGQNGFKLSV